MKPISEMIVDKENERGSEDVDMLLDSLYKKRNDLLTLGFEWDSDEVEAVEAKIEEIEELPSFDEVIQMISEGTLVSIYGGV
mgnify:CR=1 FL=1